MTLPLSGLPFIPTPAPLPIPQPTPASGTLARRPRFLVYANGELLPYCLDITVTRGLDQDVASCDITYPDPLPAWIPKWARVTVALGDERFCERFVGYLMTFTKGLWPGTITLHCEDVLALAKWTFTPEEMDLGGDTDIQAIKRILGPPAAENLGGVGFSLASMQIAGTGETLGDVDDAQLFWEEGQTALEKIQDLDSISLGHRTYATVAGTIVRRLIPTTPNAQNVLHAFKEGVDILEGSMSSETIDPKNEITVAGFGDTSTAGPDDDNPFDYRKNTYWLRFLQLKKNISGYFVGPLTVAQYILSQLNKDILKVTFSTHLDMLFENAEVISIQSPTLEVNQKLWVQSVQTMLDSVGQFTQTITCVSELGPYNRRRQTPPIETPDAPGAIVPLPLAIATVAPSALDILVRITTVAIDQERAGYAADADDRGQPIYGVMFGDASTSRQGLIVSQVWAAAGPGCTLTEGAGPTFTTFFTSFTGATVTLTVTDSNGSTASLTQPVYTAAVPVQARRLYACTETTMEAFNGNVWVSRPPTAGGVQCVGGGPYWGISNRVAYSADDLATAPTEAVAFPDGQNVDCLWVHEVDDAFVAVGGAAGGVAVSEDHGATWEQKTSPGPAVNFIIVSIHDKNEIHVVTPEGWFKSQDRGDTWGPVREEAGGFTYLELSHSRNIVVTNAGELQKAEDGTPFTGNTAPIVAATAHIRQDKFYAIAEDGTTWYVAVDGSYALVQGVSIPAGVPYKAGAYRDGQVVDLVYFAAQDGGLFKTMDGFRTAEGYLRLRSVGMLTP